ncbi:MAG: hypothetical protein GX102_04665 [Porphyromonadaceae bacterium]|nr:hypothetical protein [Porphyromonadaceae bacterium]
MRRKIRQCFRDFLAMVIRYYRWKHDPRNAEMVQYLEMRKNVMMFF